MLEQKRNIFIVGIKGVAMANLARMLTQMGNKVSGSDVAETFITEELLKENNIDVITSFDSKDLPSDTNLVIYAASHGGTDNPQVKEAQKRDITIMHQAEMLGELMKDFTNSVAICGCHGKTTSTSLMAYALNRLNKKPSFMIGTSTFNGQWAGEYNEKEFFVVEADEYGMSPPVDKTPKFYSLNPTHILATNIDFDHPDVFVNLEATKAAFKMFFEKKGIKKVVACQDNEPLADVISHFDQSQVTTYGFTDADFTITRLSTAEEKTTFDLKQKNESLGTFSTPLYGEKNVLNTVGVIVMLLQLGFHEDELRNVFDGFTGAKRRFEKVGEINDIYFFDDYAHHPEEIKATISAARARFPENRVIIIFQPHTYSRTENLKDDFVEALALADYSFIAPIFASARELIAESSITASVLENYAKQKGVNNVLSFNSSFELGELIKNNVKKGDVLFTMGAGDVYKLKNDIITAIQKLD